jgi:hypothetical protein
MLETIADARVGGVGAILECPRIGQSEIPAAGLLDGPVDSPSEALVARRALR